MLYQRPKIEIIKLNREDVIRTSGYHDSEDKSIDKNDTSEKWPI